MLESSVTNEERLKRLNKKERRDNGTFKWMTNAIGRKLKSLMSSEESYRFKTPKLEGMQPFCSAQEIDNLRKRTEDLARESKPEWAVLANYLINSRGEIGSFLTRIPTQHHPIHRLTG